MKFSSISAAAILAALSVVQAAPLSAPSSDMTTPHNKMLKVRGVSLDQDHAKREVLDRRQKDSDSLGDTTNDNDDGIGEEDNNPADGDHAKREVVNRRQDDSSSRGDTTHEGDDSIGEEDNNPADKDGKGHAKREALDRRQNDSDGQGDTTHHDDGIGEKDNNPADGDQSPADKRSVSKETKAELDALRAGALSSPPQED